MPQLFGRNVDFGLEVLDFAADTHPEAGWIEQRDRVDAGATCEQVRPALGDAVANARDGAEARHHDAPRRAISHQLSAVSKSLRFGIPDWYHLRPATRDCHLTAESC